MTKTEHAKEKSSLSAFAGASFKDLASVVHNC